jgi:tryptophan 2,3-dioxygenase
MNSDSGSVRFGEVLEAAAQLSLEEQEDLVEVLRHRVTERRREEIASEIRQARRELDAGQCEPTSPDDLLRKILS